MSSKTPEDKLVEAGLLLDIYGDLLTERQRTFMRLHFDEDLSFSDISRQYGISRQAVYDSVKHALGSLAEFESALGLLAESSAEAGARSKPQIGGRRLIERLEELRRRVDAECKFDNASWIVEELGDLTGLLRGGTEEPVEDKLVGYDVG